MRHQLVSLVLLFGAATGAAGCSHRAYPGDPRPLAQIAVVLGSFEPPTEPEFRSHEVCLLGVRGGACPDGECIGETTYAQVLPGAYDFEVGFQVVQHGSPIPFSDLYALFVNLGSLAANRDLKRRISFAVEAGKTYAIHFDPDTATYAIFVWNSTFERPARPRHLLPPVGASPCSPSPSGAASFVCRSDR